MIAISKLIALSLVLLDVRVETLTGETTTGKLERLDARKVIVATDGDKTTTAGVGEVIKIVFPAVSKPAQIKKGSLEGLLRDGSRIHFKQAQATAILATIETQEFGEVKIPRVMLRALQLQQTKPEWEAQWSAFLERKNEEDLLVFVKRDGSGLDFLRGVVSKISNKEIPILDDGNEIPVPRARVFGIVFAEDAARPPIKGAVTLKSSDGGLVSATSVELIDDKFHFQSTWGQKLSIPKDRLTELDYSGGRLHYLSDLNPLNERYFGLDPPGKKWGTLFDEDSTTRTGLSSQWRYSRDRFPNNGRPPLMLDRTSYRKGLCIFPSAALEYALDGQYSRFTAIVGVDDDVAFNQQKGRPPTAVELRIEADGEEVFKRLIHAPEKPYTLELDMNGVTTLTIFVDFGDGESTCDYLDLADAKLIVANE